MRFTVQLRPETRPRCCEQCGGQLPATGSLYRNPEGDPLCWNCFMAQVQAAACGSNRGN